MVPPVSILQGCTLTYFGIAGRGESIRLALSIAVATGKMDQWTDHRIEFPDWKSIKSTTPWGSLPVLTLQDGREIAQQRAILRFIGKEIGLYPSVLVIENDNNYLAAKMDEFMDAVEDVGSKTNAIGQGFGQSEKEMARKQACQAPDGVIYNMLQRIDTFIATHGQNGHVMGDKLSIADLFLYTATCNLVGGLYDGVPADTCDAFPNITACRKLVRAHPAVTKWYNELQSPIWPSYAAFQ
jgi:glutathione S-transferase